MSEKITIITVCYNAVELIEKTIQSVLKQTYSNVEYIIVDGGSQDGTVEIIKEYNDKISHWISEPDKGIYYAMNKATKFANGDWINFMNCGDTFCNESILSNVFNKKISDEITVIYGMHFLEFSYGKFLYKPGPLEYIDKSLPFCHQASFVRTSVMKEKLFDTNFFVVADHNLFYYLYKNDFRFLYVDLPIANFALEGGVSSKNTIKSYIESSKITGMNNRKLYFFELGFVKLKVFLIGKLPQRILQTIRINRYLKNKCVVTRNDYKLYN